MKTRGRLDFLRVSMVLAVALMGFSAAVTYSQAVNSRKVEAGHIPRVLTSIGKYHPLHSLLGDDEYGWIDLWASQSWTSPFGADDGGGDGCSGRERVVLRWGDPGYTDGDHYFYDGPAWWLGATKIGGAWTLDGWHVEDAVEVDRGVLVVDLDRNVLSDDLKMELWFFDHASGSLYVDLLDTQNAPVKKDLFGNLVSGSDRIAARLLRIPLSQNPAAVAIQLRRGEGAVTICETLLCVEKTVEVSSSQSDKPVVASAHEKSGATGEDVNGLLGTYFIGMNLVTQRFTRIDSQINFEWGSGSPNAEQLGNDYFSVRWTGWIEVPATETYTFTTRTDDGVRLWVSDQLLINKWIPQSPTEHSGSITLEAGRRYPLVMEFYEQAGGAVAQLSWQSPSLAKQIVSSNYLWLVEKAPEAQGILREWWLGISGTSLGLLRGSANYPHAPSGSEIMTNFFEGPVNWADNYGTRMRGYFVAPETGSYRFYLATDDDGELWLSSDENPAGAARIAYISGWASSRQWDKVASQRSEPIALVAGNRYYIEALQKEGTGGDNIAVGVDLPSGAMARPIPASMLRPVNTALAPNQAPVVSAGPDQVVTLAASALLSGSAIDDGLPSGTLSVQWSKVSGPGVVTFGNSAALSTTAGFSTNGTYVLRLTASDGALSAGDEISVVVEPEPFAGVLVLALNSGGAASGMFSADAQVSGGSTYSSSATISTDGVTDSAPQEVYRSERYGNFTYTLGGLMPGAAYTLRLHFAEIYWDAVGKRIFDVAVNGVPRLTGVDLIALTGGKNRAVVRELAAIADGNGVITIGFSTITDNAKLSGLEVFSNLPVNEPPIVNAGMDQTITLPASAMLDGTATDDGLPSGALAVAWSKVSGPGAVMFGNGVALNTTASFSTNGVYVLRLTASDGALSASDEVQVTVNPAPVIEERGVLREWWLGISGNYISQLRNSANYPHAPSGTEIVTNFFEGPVSWADNYGTRMRGYFVAPQTGAYRFYIATDDDGELWLSTDENPANATRIANVSGWTSSRQWDKFASQRSETISLVAGNRYYIEALQKEGSGGDNIAVGVDLPDGTQARPIPGHMLRPVDPALTSNLAPVVNAGPDQTILLPGSAVLAGTARDDGLPANSLVVTWSKVSGPGSVTFENASVPSTRASFSAEGAYVLRLAASDTALSSSDEVQVTVIGASGGANVNGLLAEYFIGMNLATHRFARVDSQINYEWGEGGPNTELVGNDYFSVRWTGWIEAPATETYTFTTRTDDGVRLWVNGQLLINKWIAQSPTEHSASVALQAGKRYLLVMEYYEQAGGAVAQLRWSSPSLPKQIVSSDRFWVGPEDQNQAPVIQSIAKSSTANNHSGGTFSFIVNATDPDGDPLVYQFNVNGQGWSAYSASNRFDWQSPEAYRGLVAIQVRARDPGGTESPVAVSQAYVFATPPKP